MSVLSKMLGVDINVWAELKKDLVADLEKVEAWALSQFPALKERALAAIQTYLSANGAATQAEAIAYANSQVDSWISALVTATPVPAEFAPYKATVRDALVTLANSAVDSWIAEAFASLVSATKAAA